jgi:hypothetical protein
MRIGLWAALFVVCNIVGVEVFKAAVVLPLEDALWPRVLAVPMIGLTALSATRVLHIFGSRDR